MNSYSYSVACANCHTEWHVGHVQVSLPVWFADCSRQVCPRCFLAVVLPRRVEARFLRALREDQMDEFGNPSAFRSRLAREIRPYASGHRPYELVTIPDLEFRCPVDGATLEAWHNYPEDPALICPRCGSRAGQATPTGEIGCGVLTSW